MARIRIRVNPSRKPSRTRTIKPKQRVPISNILRKKVRTIERKGKTRKRTKSSTKRISNTLGSLY